MPLIKYLGSERVKIGKGRFVQINGERLDSGEECTFKFFASDTKLANELEEYGAGEYINVKMAKNKNDFWDVTGFDTPDRDLIESVKGKGREKPSEGWDKAKGGSKMGKSSSLSKEEWAAKDRKTAESIARAVSLKVANDNTKVGTTPKSIVVMAKEFESYLLGEDTKSDGSDPLDPPNLYESP
jgi:hypothetical protein